MTDTPTRWARFFNWVRYHKIWIIVGVGVVLILSASLVTFVLLYRQPKREAITPAIQPKPKPPVVYYSPLNGLKIDARSDETAPVTGVMIENSPDARPQSGLKQADAVYEAIAEGGITRFLALYQQSKPSVVGPVRSVRLYDLDWLSPYHASLAHVGGSAEALKTIRSEEQWRDLDQFFNAGSYHRTSDRAAPHNVYTGLDQLITLGQSKGFTSSNFTSFGRVDGSASKTPDASHLAINFSSALYNTTYQWDAATNTYARSEGGAPHIDREEGQITPSVVVALHVDETTVLQDGYREHITTSGSGEADIFQNGTVTKATWRKNDQSSPLELIDATGKPISLVRGQTWIAAVPNGRGSVSWQ